MNAFGLERFTGISDKRGRASEVANPQDQLRGVIQRRTILCLGATTRTRELDGAGGDHRQIIATSLCWASVSPSMYRWVVWIDR
jgi:hypothetical protein